MENNQIQSIEIAEAAWSSKAAIALSEVGNPEDYASQIKAGAKLFKVEQGGAGIGFYLLRIDQTAEGAEGVLVAAVGRADFDLTAAIVPVIEKQFYGCRSIRIHTGRPGLAKKLSKAGYHAAEIVLRKSL